MPVAEHATGPVVEQPSEPDPPATAEPQAETVASETAEVEIPEDPFGGLQMFRDDVAVDTGLAYRHAGTAEDPIPIDVDFLGAWEFDETADPPFPPYVLQADGKKVKITGFMLPDVDFEHITEFHVVRSLWGCCFGAPPRLNELVRVTIPGGEGIDYTYNNIEVVGTLTAVFEMEDGVVEDLYRIQADSVTVLDEFNDPGGAGSVRSGHRLPGCDPRRGFLRPARSCRGAEPVHLPLMSLLLGLACCSPGGVRAERGVGAGDRGTGGRGSHGGLAGDDQ